MEESRNQHQIIRKDNKNCFVESLSDAFEIGKAHLAFATYDLNKPAGNRQTNCVHIYISIPEWLELCRKLACGELRYLWQERKRPVTIGPFRNGLAAPLRKNCFSMGKPDQMAKACPESPDCVLRRSSTFCLPHPAAPATRIPKGLSYPGSVRNRKTMLPSA